MGNKPSSSQVKPGRHGTDAESDLDLFLLGKTGHGKSATGNTILGRKKFKVSDSMQSDTLDTDSGWVENAGKIIKVLDGPGLLDTRLAGVRRLDQMVKNVWQGFRNCPNGFHALLLVLSYGTRFTDEEERTVKLLKGILGEDCIKNHCILVFTRGEDFEDNKKGKKFEDWCQEQRGFFHELFEECGKRVVLFHNQRPEKRNESIGRLFSIAFNLEKRYTTELFNNIATERNEFIRKEGAIHLKELIQSKVDLIIDRLERKETDTVFADMIDELEKEINKENSELLVVRDVRRGIQQARKGHHTRAMVTFQRIEYNGVDLISRLNHVIVEILSHSLRSLGYLDE